MKSDPDAVLAGLKAKMSKRAHKNLDLLHEVCREINESPFPKNYGVTEVGRRSEARQGPKTNTLLSPGGRHFRMLIEEWKRFAGVTEKIAKRNDDDTGPNILDRIDDPVLKQIIARSMADLRRTRTELNELKKTPKIIDMRPRVENSATSLALPMAELNSADREALSQPLDERWRKRMGLSAGPHGEITTIRPFRPGEDVLPVGFIDALAKLLAT